MNASRRKATRVPAARPSLLEIRRCRPLLGTFVEIGASSSKAQDLARGIEAAFLAVEGVHRLMSFHEPESDVSRMNRDAFHKPVRVHPWTWRVLKAAEEFSRHSDGVFDVTTARQLVRWKYLPKRPVCGGRGSWRDIIVEENCHVCFRRPLIVDLGGIAKGFAVDRAVEVLEEKSVTSGIVNAGGDLRVFGRAWQLVHLRRPEQPTRVAGAVKLRRRAIATSGIYLLRKKVRGGCVSPLLDGRSGRAARELISVTVAAADCMTADALTKIAFALRQESAPLLARYCADALIIERDGAPSWMFHPTCDTSRQS
jgi:thiamine biosynthesis lipoprotein